ncbi:type II toxin-antitoxin system HicB family antitoxin [Bacteroidota bacterium]
MSGKFTMIIEHDNFGYYGYCPELKGCQTQGETHDEATENLKEAVSLYIETLSVEEKQELFNKEVTTTFHEVELV